jgi:hypothetical protein
MPLGLSAVAKDALKVAVDGNTAFFLSASALESKFFTSEGISTAGINEPPCMNGKRATGSFALKSHRWGIHVFHRIHPCFLQNLATVTSGIIEEEFIKWRTFHLVGIFASSAQRLPKPESTQTGFVPRAKFGAIFSKEPGIFHLVPNSQLLKKLVASGQKGFTNAKSGEFFFFQYDGF